MPKIGIRFDGFEDAPETFRVAALAEEAGATGLWMTEHIGYRESLVSCMAFAMRTKNAVVIPADDVRKLGFEHILFRGMKSYNGVAILSRVPLVGIKKRLWCDKDDCRHLAAKLPDGTELHNFTEPNRAQRAGRCKKSVGTFHAGEGKGKAEDAGTGLIDDLILAADRICYFLLKQIDELI